METLKETVSRLNYAQNKLDKFIKELDRKLDGAKSLFNEHQKNQARDKLAVLEDVSKEIAENANTIATIFDGLQRIEVI